MTDEQLAVLEKMRADVAISAVAEIFQHFPEIAKDLREARAERDNLAHELKCSNETIDMLYEKSRRYVEQVDKYVAEAKRLQDIVEVYDDRFATLNDEKNEENRQLKEEIKKLTQVIDKLRTSAVEVRATDE